MRSTHILRDIVPGGTVLLRLLDRSSDGFIETGFDGMILHANTAAAHLLAGKGAIPSGFPFADFVHADSHRAFASLLNAVHLPDYPREAAVRLRSSHAGSVNVLLSVEMAHDEEGMRLWWNIRPDADAEYELKIFRTLMDQSNDSLFVIDPLSGRMLDVNEAAHVRLGYTREQLLSLTIIDIENSLTNVEEWVSAMERLRTVVSIIMEGNHRRRDGSIYPVEVSIKLITVGDRDFVVTVGRDVTERKRTEESLRLAHDLLLKRMDERTAEVMEMMARFERARDSQAQFVADASHDLMTPLTVMRAEVDLLLQDSGLDGGTRQALDRVHGESQRLDRLASDLLLLATVATMGSELIRHTVSLTEMVMECVTEVEGVAARRVILDLDLEDVPEIQSVPPILSRALVSVIDNAAKYSPEGGTVRIRVFSTEQRVLVEVADQGPGIPPEDLPRVFDRFYRGDRSRSTQGTGLGLPIVKAVMELHGGDVVIDSNPGTGTLVRLGFPLRELPATE
ncbi:MAG: multi-sensor signal transduction histidine kinase [Chlorobi bacterium]|nr:multi-sensor signal transduction histidine kinase [Chlorobiota bacterium]